MINLYQNYSLKEYNTFNIDANAKYFLEFDNLHELEEVLKNSNINESNFFILGGGSNVLFTENFNGIILHPKFQGISIIEENDNFAFVKVGANVEWDKFVEYAVNNNLGGIENLSKIPGTVGSSPVQNIGAYGAEVKDVIDKVEAFNITTFNSGFFTNDQCEFQYRSSVFKNKYKNNYIITSVIFKLSKKHILNINYKDLQTEIGEIENITIKDVRNAIIKIRENKLPDHTIWGNAGSFFKNPVISKNQFEKIQKQYPNIAHYKLDNKVKIAAAWLIEESGWKGKSEGGAAVDSNHALILINKNNATGLDVSILATKIKKSVWFKFGIELEPEVNIL